MDQLEVIALLAGPGSQAEVIELPAASPWGGGVIALQVESSRFDPQDHYILRPEAKGSLNPCGD